MTDLGPVNSRHSSEMTKPFTYAQGRAVGLTPGQLRSNALQHPFRGIRSLGLDLDATLDMCLAYTPRMPHLAVFSHSTAARLWSMPLPASQLNDLHVVVPIGQRAPRGRGVVGHQQRLLADKRRILNDMAVASPAATWAQIGEILSVDDLIAVGEHIITGNPYEKRLPLATLDELSAATGARHRGPGQRNRIAALPQIRDGALSRPETFVRLLLTRCGLPEPAINAAVLSARGEFIAMPDLQWPEFRVALEYQGDHHREKGQFRRDVSRLERLIDADWLVVQVTAAELFGDPRVIVERVARRLRSRGWTGRIHLHRVATFQR
jgi:hypothetical protein